MSRRLHAKPSHRHSTYEEVLQGDYIPHGEQAATERNTGFSARKQAVLNSIIERMRAEKSAEAYATEQKNRPAPVSILSDYA